MHHLGDQIQDMLSQLQACLTKEYLKELLARNCQFLTQQKIDAFVRE